MNGGGNIVCALTGASGYVGSVIEAELAREIRVVPLNRRPKRADAIQWDFTATRDITSDLRSRGVDVLVHAAWDMRASNLAELQRICVEGSRRLYESARAAGVRGIVFISTISAFDGCRSAYGKSKMQVERLTKEYGGVVIRPGLVYGARSGGAFGAMRNQIQKSSVVPLIGDGRAPQYLIDERTLAGVILRAVKGEFDESAGEPITVAHPQPWPFRELLDRLAAESGRTVRLVPIPWQALYAGLRAAEMLGLRLKVRSDSILSFVYQNTNPDFSALQKYDIHPDSFAF
jgi:nucleoside-diphosphate-sugar epimerase